MGKGKRKSEKRGRVDDVGHGGRVGGRPRRVDKQWSRMTRLNVEPEVWLKFRRLCQGRQIAVSDALAELVVREVKASEQLDR